MSENDLLGEIFCNQVSSSIKSLFDLTTRIDERVEMMMEKQAAFEKKIDTRVEKENELATKINILNIEAKNLDAAAKDIEKVRDLAHSLEVRLRSIEIMSDGQEGRWKSIWGFVVQLIWAIFASYILYKLGIQPAP